MSPKRWKKNCWKRTRKNKISVAQKHRFKFDKLIRDNLPEILKTKDVFVSHTSLGHEDCVAELKKKLLEEGMEVGTATSSEEIREELGDVLEVVHALAEASGMSFKEIEEARLKKQQQRGSFQKGIYCYYVEMTPNDKNQAQYNYFLSNPSRYPQID